MQDAAAEVAELRRQLAEERRAREEERRAREEAERRLQPNTLLQLLDRCHESLSQAIRVETNATLTTQGTVTDPVNRLFPKQMVPWVDFPRLQQQIWKKLKHAVGFTSRPLFPSDTQLDYVATNIRGRSIYSEATLRNFERDTVDNFVEKIIEAIRGDETLQEEFGIEGRVAFYDRTTSTSLDESLEQMHLTERGRGGRRGRKDRGKQRAQSQRNAHSGRRRNRRADQFCVHVVADEAHKPLYAVEFKAPHKLTVAELVAGLHEMDLARDVIDQEGDTFEFHATRLVAAVGTQIFSYMHDLGVRNGCIRTGEAFVFLHIPADPTILQYYLCVPNHDVQTDDGDRLHRSAVGQMLAFTLQALAAEAPSQEWHDTAQEQLLTWKVEYLDVLRHIPETIRKEPPPSNYRPSRWKPDPKTHNTRSRARCQADRSTPANSPGEGSSDSDEDIPSPSTAAAARRQPRRGRGSGPRSTGRGARNQKRRVKETASPDEVQFTRPYCSMACIRGIIDQGPLDEACPNRRQHGEKGYHLMGAQEFTRRLHRQLVRNRNKGFEPLHIRGRTGFLLRATLLSHGYTVVIKATTDEKQLALQTEVSNYRHLQSLQGYQIPVCLGYFKPKVPYWYHGRLMAHMAILNWSGTRLQKIINDENEKFFSSERDKCLTVLRSHGVIHKDKEWRNMLWDEITKRLIVIDLEDMAWFKRPRPLQPISGNLRSRHTAGARNNKQRRRPGRVAIDTSS
ncbi:hypothetical protein BDV59DRAFT_189431 [Aspergillus ambiguus]|uniref:uncharacterized protein n=1 Tax=Aspergillus ambiguus TaxID=176160 RepID=UPI003CCDBC60